MITLTRLNQTQVVVNADLIEFVECTPDTVVTMVTGRKLLVRESTEEVIARVIAYRQAAGRASLRSIAATQEGTMEEGEEREGRR